MAISRNMPVTVLFVLVFLLPKCEQSPLNETSKAQSRPTILEKWMKMDEMLKAGSHSLVKMAIPFALEHSRRINITAECSKEIMQVIVGVRNLKPWAVNFIDSSSKSIDGLLSGTISSLGAFEQCLDTVAMKPKDPSKVLFRGQYCTLNIKPPLPPKTRRYRVYDELEELKNFNGSDLLKTFAANAHLFHISIIKMTFGVCTPSGCTAEDVAQIANLAGNQFFLTVDGIACEIKEKAYYSKTHITVILICSLLGLLVAVGTIMDTYSTRRKIHFSGKINNILLEFSVTSNFKRLFSTKSSRNDLSCLHGIRFLSITWVCLGHSYLFAGFSLYLYQNLFRVKDLVSALMAQTIMNSSVVLVAFFFMSGLLLSHATIKDVTVEKCSLDFKYLIRHRLWRIFPSYSFVIIFSLLTPLMSSGPTYRAHVDELTKPCYKYWWKNLLFINNFSPKRDQCLSHSWYMGCDFQLFLFGLLTLLPLMRYPRIGIAINVLLILVSIIYSGAMTYANDLQPTLIPTYPDAYDVDLFIKYTYGNPLSNAGPYCMGILLGYILIRKPKIELSLRMQVLGWCLAILSTIPTLYSTRLMYNVGQVNPVIIALYAAFYKVSWAFGVGWMTFRCLTGHGGFINDILSWKVWIPLARLTFLIYLIQPIVQTCFIGITKSTRQFAHFYMITEFLGILCISTFLAFLLFLLVESPFAGMEKHIFPKKVQKKENKPVTVTIQVDSSEEKLEINDNAYVESQSNGIPNVELKLKTETDTYVETQINGISDIQLKSEMHNPTTYVDTQKSKTYESGIDNKGFTNNV